MYTFWLHIILWNYLYLDNGYIGRRGKALGDLKLGDMRMQINQL